METPSKVQVLIHIISLGILFLRERQIIKNNCSFPIRVYKGEQGFQMIQNSTGFFGWLISGVTDCSNKVKRKKRN